MIALAYAAYFGVRALTRGDVSRAVAHAADILRLERRLDLDWETAVQGVVIGRGALVDAVNAVYVWGHWPLLIVGGFLLFHLGRQEYLRLRTVILVSGALGLVVFGLFPVAPPRLAPIGLQDTVALHAKAYHSILVPSLVNEYAAMPSFHAGWNLLLGIELFRVSRNVFVRAFAVAAPLAMAFSVVATANHFVLDVLAGAVVVVVPLVALSLRTRTRAGRGSLRGPRAHQRGADRALAAARDPRRAPVRDAGARHVALHAPPRRRCRCGKPAAAGVPTTDAPAVSASETRTMFSSPTSYRSGSRSVEVLPGESHSAAWMYVARGGPRPEGYPCEPGPIRIRRRLHRSSRRQPHRHRALMVP